MDVTFRRLVDDDLPLLHRWLNEPGVVRWWEGDDVSWEGVVAHYGSQNPDRSEHWLALVDGEPVGWIQCYAWADYADEDETKVHFALGVDEAAAGIDYLVGDPERRGHGVGAAMIGAFVDEVVFGAHPTWTQVSAGPYVENEASWRALERAGFRALGDHAWNDGTARVMVKDRPSGEEATPTDEPRRSSGVVAALLVVLALVPLAASLAVVAPGWLPVGDDATIVMRGRDLLTGETPLLGMPSAVGEQTGRPVHHPGPLELWWVGAWVRAVGIAQAPLLAAAAAWAGATVALLALARRLGGLPLLALAAVQVALATWSLRGEVPVTPFNVHVIVVPLAAYVVALVAWHRGVRFAGLAAIVLGSWAAQAHLTAVGPVAVAGAVVVGAVALHRVRSVHRPRIERRPIANGLGVLVLCWTGPIVDVLTNGGGNVRAVLGARADLASEAIGLGTATDIVVRALALRPVWAQAGAHPARLVVEAEAWHWATAAAVLAIGVLGAVRRRRSHPSLAVAVIATLAALVTGAVLAARFPGDYLSLLALHNHLWLWPLTALVWSAACVAVGLEVRDLARRASPSSARRLAEAWIGVAGVGLVVVGIASLGAPHRNLTLAEPTYVRALADGAAARLEPGATHRVGISGEFDRFFVEVGLLAELEDLGLDVVGPTRYRRAFGDRRVDPAGPVAGELEVHVGWDPATAEAGPPLATYEPPRELLAQRAAVEDDLVDLVRRHPQDLPLWGMEGTDDAELRRWLRQDLDAYLLARLVPGWMAAAEETDRYLDLRREPILHASVHLVDGDR